MNNLQIFSFSDRNPELLELQIDSFKKHCSNADLNIVNSSILNESAIDSICKNSGINCIKYSGNRNVPFKYYYVEQLAWFRDTIQKSLRSDMMFIHADMFFINEFNHSPRLANKKICLNPQYRFSPRPISYIWDGIVLLDNSFFIDNDLIGLFDWGYVEGISDVGGKTSNLLGRLDSNDCSFVEFWSIVADSDGDNFKAMLNGNIQYDFSRSAPTLSPSPRFKDRSFEYETPRPDYNEYFSGKIFTMYDEFVKKYDFPHPVNIDLIQFMGEDILKAPLIHMKSGSWDSSYNNSSYKSQKIAAITRAINGIPS